MSISKAVTVRARTWSAKAKRRYRIEQLSRFNKYPVDVDPSCRVAMNARLWTPTTIGAHSAIDEGALFKGNGPVTIGRYVVGGRDLLAITSNHRATSASAYYPMYTARGWEVPSVVDAVTIGDAVWLGDRVTILPGVTIGDGAIVAAGAVVVSDIAPWTIVGGVPAKAIRPRFAADVVDLLSQLRWWEWPEDRIDRNRRFFEADLDGLSADDVRALVVE